jgi:hypothetical protein
MRTPRPALYRVIERYRWNARAGRGVPVRVYVTLAYTKTEALLNIVRMFGDAGDVHVRSAARITGRAIMTGCFTDRVMPIDHAPKVKR